MQPEQYAELYHRYIDLARRVAMDISRAYGRVEELIEEAESALGHILMNRWKKIEAEGRNKATCVAHYVRFWLLDYCRKMFKNRKWTYSQLNPKTMPTKRQKEFQINEVPEQLRQTVEIILENPEAFKCRSNVLKYTSTPVCRFWMDRGMSEAEAICIQVGLEEHFKDLSFA